VAAENRLMPEQVTAVVPGDVVTIEFGSECAAALRHRRRRPHHGATDPGPLRCLRPVLPPACTGPGLLNGSSRLRPIG
jgi:hypothetical protein